MDSLVNDFAAGILTTPAPPCLSLYQPTHRHHPGNQQDPIRFRNLVKTIEEALRQKFSARDVRPLVEPFQALAENAGFWNHTLDGLAVLGAPGTFRVYRLQRTVPELAIVAESFHVKPLLRILQSADRYQVLGVSRQEIKLYEGNRDVLDELELSPAATEVIAEAREADVQQSNLSVWTHGSDSATAGVRQSQGSEDRAVDSAAERFFRAVDHTILEHHSRPSGLPLLLASLPQHQGLFRRMSHNPFLMSEGIDIDPHALTIEELRARAWQVVEPHYLTRLAGLVEIFGSARSKGLGSDDLAPVADDVDLTRDVALPDRIAIRVERPASEAGSPRRRLVVVERLPQQIGDDVADVENECLVHPLSCRPTRRTATTHRARVPRARARRPARPVATT